MSKGYDEENAVAAQIFCDPHFIGCSTELIACPIALAFWSELPGLRLLSLFQDRHGLPSEVIHNLSEVGPIQFLFDRFAHGRGGQKAAHFLHEVLSHVGPGFDGVDAFLDQGDELGIIALVIADF